MNDLDCSDTVSLAAALTEPVALNACPDGPAVHIMVETAYRIHESNAIIGWCSDPNVVFTVEQDTRALASTTLHILRSDVIHALGLAPDSHCGFVVIVDLAPVGDVTLRVSCKGQKYSLAITSFDTATELQDPNLITQVAASLSEMTIGSAEWSSRISLLGPPEFKPDKLSGFVDHAYMTDAGGVVAGWALATPDVNLWIEDDAGRCYDLGDSFRWWRQDVEESDCSIRVDGQKTGFIRALRASRNARSFRLGGCSAQGRLYVPETAVTRKRADVASMARALFDINTPRFDLVTRVNKVDIPVLAAVNRAARTSQAHTKPVMRIYGSPPDTPSVSIIIPLYERYDMMELQLLEFAKDPDFKSTCEVIYINDDPRHAQALIGTCGPLHDITGVPFRVIYSGHNLGFSGANNVGAGMAKGNTLIFMNSDVFPTQSGWATALRQHLLSNTDFGIIAPRLVFPNGSLQHIGMEPVWRDAFELWTNRHPMMGFDPSCDPAVDLTEVPLVSGACVALRARDLEAVGGWSTDYLIGDFEDSDLCLTLREKGLKSGYLPSVSLTHIERQSMVGIGADTFRERITLLNAALYNKRWYKTLQRLTA